MGPKRFYKSSGKFSKKAGSSTESEYIRSNEHTWLIIVESPSKCTKIEHLLGSQYKCIASKGHLRTIKGLKSIDSKKNFAIQFSTIETKTNHIESMRKIIKQFPEDKILLASDDDREGEAIAWHICDIFELDVTKTQRIIFHEITKAALENAVQNPTKINMNIVHAQWARQVLDVLIGYKISPLLWKYIHNTKSDGLSAGRCQTPALRLVYDNEMERISGEGFQQAYKIIGKFSSKNLDFILNREFENKDEVLTFLKKNIGFTHELSIGSPRNSVNGAPKPFNTSCLLQTCNNMLKLSPTDTMSICQELYQGGFITYMRTENRKYAGPFLKIAREFVSNSFGETYIGNLNIIENKDSSNPHEAIRVTNLNVRELDDKTGKKAAVYRLIWKNTVQSCMADAKQELVDALITAPDDLVYKHTIEIPIFLGWKKCANTEGGSLEGEQNKGSGLLLFLKSLIEAKSPIVFQKIDATCVFHNRHSHYTESSLIKKLEEFGIGRPSTFAMFIETIQERGYVLKQDIPGEKRRCVEYVLKDGRIIENQKEVLIGNEKTKLVIQPIGMLVIQFLMKYFDNVFSYDYTKNLEDKLDDVASNRDIEWYSICDDCSRDIKTSTKPVNDILREKYTIDEEHSIIFTTHGPVILQKNGDTDEEEKANMKSIRKDVILDIDRLKTGGYKIQDLEESEEKSRLLGKWENEDIYLKHGRFGHYLEWGSQKKACTFSDDLDPNMVTIEDVPDLLQSKLKENKSVLRILNDNLSIRRGKFGAYIYYKTASMSKPQFFNLKKFDRGFSTCEKETLLEWIEKTYLVG